MKIVFNAVIGGTISNMRFEQDNYVLQVNENILSSKAIPNISPIATWDGTNITDDLATWQSQMIIPQWGQDLISSLAISGTLDVTTLSAATQAAFANTSTGANAIKAITSAKNTANIKTQ